MLMIMDAGDDHSVTPFLDNCYPEYFENVSVHRGYEYKATELQYHLKGHLRNIDTATYFEMDCNLSGAIASYHWDH